MTPDKCPVHGLPWKWVPAGTSKKTGVAYTGFHACPERGCQQRPKPDAPATAVAPPAGKPDRPSPSPAGTHERTANMWKALEFAGRVHQGSSDGLAAIVTAREAFRALQAGFPVPPALKDGDWEPTQDADIPF